MKSNPLLIAPGLLLGLAAAPGTVLASEAPEATDLADEITDVTVYSDQAAVTRSAAIRLDAGTHRLLFEALPAGAMPSTVQANSSSGRVKLVERVPDWSPPPQDRSIEAQRQVVILQTEAARLMERYSNLAAETNILIILPRNPVRREDELGADLIDSGSFVPTREWVETRLASMAAEAAELRVRAREIREEIERLQRDIRPPPSTGRERVLVTIELARAGTVTVETTVRVRGPRWIPAYDLQLDPDSGIARMQLSALVSQTTGADWEGATMRFSTAQPSAAANLPRLAAWYLEENLPPAPAYYEPEPMAEAEMSRSVATADRRRARESAGASQAARSRAPAASAPAPARDAAFEYRADDDFDGVADEEAWYDELEEQAAMDGLLQSQAGLFGGTLGAASGDVGGMSGEIANLLGATGSTSPGGGGRMADMSTVLRQGGAGAQLVLGPAPDGSPLVGSPPPLTRPRTNSSQPPWGRFNPQVAARGFDFAYDSTGPVTLLGDGTVQRIPLTVFELPVRYEHRVPAVIEEAAFLTAVIEQSNGLPLLGGQAQIFDRGELLGITDVATAARGEDIEVALGPDPQVRIEREVQSEADRSGAIGGEKITRQVSVRIQNLRSGPVSVVLQDRLPVAYQEGVRVREGEFSRAPDEREDDGRVSWSLEVPAQGTEEISWDYTITHPRNTAVQER